MHSILVVNAGSSGIKFATYRLDGPDGIAAVLHGDIAAGGADIALHVRDAHGATIERSSIPMSGHDFDQAAALEHLFERVDALRGDATIVAVGHRVVHGGERYTAPVVVDDAVRRDLQALVPLAPLHQPHNLEPIDAVARRWPGVAQVACFDTAFHATMPAVAKAIALPREITDRGIRRFGFHGLSYEFIATRLPAVLGERARGKVVVAHLGNGASLCAMVDGRSVATTMGFSVLDGLVMGTRCGTLDAGVVLYLMQAHRFDVDRLTDLLYHRAGLLGVSGVSSDMPTLLASDDPHAAEAIELFVHRIVVEIGGLAAAMGGLDALVFTAGIGEHAASIRERVCVGCRWLGAEADAVANAAHHERIEAPTSRMLLAVVPTDEERMIALHTRQAIERVR